MKILCFIDSFGSGGAQRQMINLAKGFKAKGHDVSLLAYFDETFYIPLIEEYGLSYYCIENRNFLARFLKVRSFIRCGNYDVVLSFMVTPSFINIMSSLPARSWKVCVGERGSGGFKYGWKTRIMRQFHFLADDIISNSNCKIEDTLEASWLLNKRQTHTIYNALDLDFWTPNLEHKYRSNGKLNMVIAASYVPLKNLHGLIAALLALSSQERDKFRISWFGNISDHGAVGDYYDKCNKLIATNNMETIITLHHATNDIRTVYHNADVIALFSLFEGFPNTVCEGMACGKPIFCSKVSDLPRLITDNINGLLFNANDTTEIADKLRSLLELNSDQLNEMGKANRNLACELFDYDKNVEKYLRLFSRK